LDDRPEFLDTLLPRLDELRSRVARPHWIVVDEAHHMLHRGRGEVRLPSGGGLLLITVHPERLARDVLSQVNVVVATGEDAEATLESFIETSGAAEPGKPIGEGPTVLWRIGEEPVRFSIAESRTERRRHVRKYAEGELGEDKSFYFRGPDGKLKLRAQNLDMFVQMAEGVDDETWAYHLGIGDIARWFREAIKDDALGEEATDIAVDASADPDGGRKRIIEAIRARYTAPE
jgi:hypothetical protein